MYKDLINKKVLVTGSSYGMGLEIAKNFSKAGSVIALNGRNKSKLKKAAKNIYSSKMIHGNVEDQK
jgi:gluconate 5-dehydrogenase